MKLDLGERVDFWSMSDGGSSLTYSLWESLSADLGLSRLDDIHHELKDSLWASLGVSLRTRLDESLSGVVLWPPLRDTKKQMLYKVTLP